MAKPVKWVTPAWTGPNSPQGPIPDYVLVAYEIPCPLCAATVGTRCINTGSRGRFKGFVHRERLGEASRGV